MSGSATEVQASASKPEQPATTGTIYVDATGQIAGRLCSRLASEILKGKRIVVLNAEKAVVSGRRGTVLNAWTKRLELGSKVNPDYGPLHPRRPDNVLWRMVRGMVPKTKPKGTAGLKRLRVYMGVPQRYTGVKLTKFDDTMATRPLPMYTTVEEISRNIGWSG